MKLHSDSVIDKLEDKEKEYDQLEKQILLMQEQFEGEKEDLRIDVRAKEEES